MADLYFLPMIIKIDNCSINVDEAIKNGEKFFKESLKGLAKFDLNTAWAQIVSIHGNTKENTGLSKETKKSRRSKKTDEGDL